MNFIKTRRLGFVGTGNLASAVIAGIVESGVVKPEKITIYNRTVRKQEALVKKYQVIGAKNPEEAAEKSDFIFIGTKPQDLYDAVRPFAFSLGEEKVVVSFAAGISLKSLKKIFPNVSRIVRVMPNTAVQIRKGVIGICMTDEAKEIEDTVYDILSPLGKVITVDEGEAFEGITVSASAGIGFVFELMTYWGDWLEERGFSSEEARDIVIQTFLGASELAASVTNKNFSELQEAVTSKKGVTSAGLDSMREEEIERLLRIAFEKAAIRDQEIGKSNG